MQRLLSNKKSISNSLEYTPSPDHENFHSVPTINSICLISNFTVQMKTGLKEQNKNTQFVKNKLNSRSASSIDSMSQESNRQLSFFSCTTNKPKLVIASQNPIQIGFIQQYLNNEQQYYKYNSTILQNSQGFTFDAVYSSEQQRAHSQIYKEQIKPKIDSLFNNENSTVLIYGPSNSGKRSLLRGYESTLQDNTSKLNVSNIKGLVWHSITDILNLFQLSKQNQQPSNNNKKHAMNHVSAPDYKLYIAIEGIFEERYYNLLDQPKQQQMPHNQTIMHNDKCEIKNESQFSALYRGAVKAMARNCLNEQGLQPLQQEYLLKNKQSQSQKDQSVSNIHLIISLIVKPKIGQANVIRFVKLADTDANVVSIGKMIDQFQHLAENKKMLVICCIHGGHAQQSSKLDALQQCNVFSLRDEFDMRKNDLTSSVQQRALDFEHFQRLKYNKKNEAPSLTERRASLASKDQLNQTVNHTNLMMATQQAQPVLTGSFDLEERQQSARKQHYLTENAKEKQQVELKNALNKIQSDLGSQNMQIEQFHANYKQLGAKGDVIEWKTSMDMQYRSIKTQIKALLQKAGSDTSQEHRDNYAIVKDVIEYLKHSRQNMKRQVKAAYKYFDLQQQITSDLELDSTINQNTQNIPSSKNKAGYQNQSNDEEQDDLSSNNISINMNNNMNNMNSASDAERLQKKQKSEQKDKHDRQNERIVTLEAKVRAKKELIQMLSDQHHISMAEVSKRYEILLQQHNQLLSQIQNSEQQIMEQNKHIKQMELANKQAQKDNKNDQSQEVSRLEDTVMTTTQKIKDLEECICSLERKNKKLKEQIEKHSANSNKEQSAIVSKKRSKIKELKKQVLELTERAVFSAQEVVLSKNKLEEENKANLKLKSLLQQQQSDYESLEAHMTKLKGEQAKTNKAVEQLESKNKQQAGSLAQAQIEKELLTKQLTDEKEAAEEREANSLKQVSNQIEFESMIRALRVEVQKKEEQLRYDEKQIQTLKERHSNQLYQLQSQCNQQELDNKELQNQNKMLMAKEKELSSLATDLTKQKQALQQDLEKQQESYKNIQKNLSEVDQQVHALMLEKVEDLQKDLHIMPAQELAKVGQKGMGLTMGGVGVGTKGPQISFNRLISSSLDMQAQTQHISHQEKIEDISGLLQKYRRFK